MLVNKIRRCIKYRKRWIFWGLMCPGYIIFTYLTCSTISILSTKFWAIKNPLKDEKYLSYCDRKKVNTSQPCLCYKSEKNNISEVKCAMTFYNNGRMGNRIGMHATLLVLSRLNQRPAFVSPLAAYDLTPYFKISLPVLNQELYDGIIWKDILLRDWMDEYYKHLPGNFIKLGGYPVSNTFFQGYEDEIRKEFQLKDEIRDKAQITLLSIRASRASATFVGVHVRRGDYVKIMKNAYNGVLADRKYFLKATDYFRKRYSDAVFVVVSNDMHWCRDNIPNDKGDVYFVGNKNEKSPITDFALLMNCNHSIITVGTFGFFAALFNGGQAVYLTNFTMPDSFWNKIFHFESAFPAHWHPIAADLSPLYAQLNSSTKK